MKQRPYINKTELPSVLKIGVCAGELKIIADQYKKMGWNEWAKYLRMAATMCCKVIDARVLMLDHDALIAFKRRADHTTMILESIDEKLYCETVDDERFTLSTDDFNTVCEIAIEYCKDCPNRGQTVTNCKYRQTFLRLGVPVWDSEPGERCPYCVTSEPISAIEEAYLKAKKGA